MSKLFMVVMVFEVVVFSALIGFASMGDHHTLVTVLFWTNIAGVVAVAILCALPSTGDRFSTFLLDLTNFVPPFTDRKTDRKDDKGQ